jgi:hypothetical protein
VHDDRRDRLTLSATATALPHRVPPAARRPAAARRWCPTPARFYLALAALTLTLGGLSLLAPSTPSYDAWSWLEWGRQIIHGHLVITDTGTSWKPLPMLFTIPFALLGSAVAPALWLAVARAGAVAAVLLAGRLAYRLTRALGPATDGAPVARAPAVLAGVTAIVGLGFAAKGSYITSNGLGYSEALATSLLLVAIECHLDARHRAAFLIGFLVALDRPEIWLFWVPYGLWLGRRDPPMRAVILGLFVLQPIAWFLPVYLGSGHLGSSVTRATHPRANSLAFASDPFTAELSRAAWPIMMLRVKIMAGVVVLAAPMAWWHDRRGGGPVAADDSRLRALTVTAALGLAGLSWFVVIAVMTQVGFSGNDRYLVLGAALLDVCAAVGFGWLALALTRVAQWALSTPAAAAALGTAMCAAVFAVAPGWIATVDFVSLPKVHRALLYQAHLRESLPRAIAFAGGATRLLRCGRVMSEGFQVPMVAYALDVPTTRVLAPPASPATAGRAPNVILQTRATQSSTQLPIVRDWPSLHDSYRGSAGPWRTFTRCVSGS